MNQARIDPDTSACVPAGTHRDLSTKIAVVSEDIDEDGGGRLTTALVLSRAGFGSFARLVFLC